jgi:hypothetical protein
MKAYLIAAALVVTLPLAACTQVSGNNGLECVTTDTVLIYDPWPQRGSHTEVNTRTFVLEFLPQNQFKKYVSGTDTTGPMTITDTAYKFGKWAYWANGNTREFTSEITVNGLTGALDAEDSFRVGMDGHDTTTTGTCHATHVVAKM